MAEARTGHDLSVPKDGWAAELQALLDGDVKNEGQLPCFAQHYMQNASDGSKFPDETMPAKVALQTIRDDRLLDANPRLNMASFVITYMEKEAQELLAETLPVNFIDEAEYPSSTRIHNTCVAMLADLFHAEEPCGSSTVGSSEAIILGGLAMKRRWQDRLKAEGKDPYGRRPNFVCSSAAHVCWEKLFNYLDIEGRYVNIDKANNFKVLPEKIAERCDENTIGVAMILGTTYTGHIEDVEGMDREIGKLNKKNSWHIGIHVDGASGGFIMPFLHPNVKWDFQLPNVHSINASGHKFGLVYPGVGWIMFRSKEFLPKSLIFEDNYLGAPQQTFTLNFSKGACQIMGQMYMFLRLGRPGYTRVMQHCHIVAMALAKGIEEQGHWVVHSARDPEPGVPLVCFSLKDSKRENGYDEFDVMAKLREKNWVLPAYTLAPDAEDIRVLRVLCRMDFPLRQANALLNDLDACLKWLDSHFIYTAEEVKKLKGGADFKEVHENAVGKTKLQKKDVKVHDSHHRVPHRKGGHHIVSKHGGVC